MAVVLVGCTKGGVGKSTVALHLACALAGRRRVILLDADEQRTVADWCERGRIPVACEAAPLEHERDAARWAGRVRELAADYDVVVIDAPPHVATSTEAGMLLADLVVVPIEASGAAVVAAARTVELLREARQARPGDKGRPRALLVPSRIDRRWASAGEIAETLAGFGEPVGPPVYHRSAFAVASTAGKSVLDMLPNSAAAEDIRTLARAVAKRLEG